MFSLLNRLLGGARAPRPAARPFRPGVEDLEGRLLLSAAALAPRRHPAAEPAYLRPCRPFNPYRHRTPCRPFGLPYRPYGPTYHR
jgi:hypothetical protein